MLDTARRGQCLGNHTQGRTLRHFVNTSHSFPFPIKHLLRAKRSMLKFWVHTSDQNGQRRQQIMCVKQVNHVSQVLWRKGT